MKNARSVGMYGLYGRVLTTVLTVGLILAFTGPAWSNIILTDGDSTVEMDPHSSAGREPASAEQKPV